MDKTIYIIPPVVSVLGHVDHGKTTLLDAFRKSDVAGKEHGGITQKIGASSIHVMHDGTMRPITFIDTPGHEAFSKMRSRGAQAADIVLLIVSSVDGVMPQTKESIQLLKASGVPFIVVLTKVDSPEKNIEKVKQQIVREEIFLEGYGGDVPVIEVSARTGQNVEELLHLILVLFEMKYPMEKFSKTTDPLKAIVIESKLDPKSGPKATLVIKSGTMSVKDEIHCEGVSAKIRSLISSDGVSLPSATIGQAIEVLGFEKVPAVGGIVTKKGEVPLADTEKLAKNERRSEHTLSLILYADTFGSLEAIIASLPKEVFVMEQKTGEVSEADVLLAKSTGSIILTFNVKLRPDIMKFAQTEKVLLKNYTIIYEMLDEVQQVIEGKAQALMEQIYGVAQIQATFPFDKSTVLGVTVMDGRIARGDKIRIMRGEDNVVGESSIVSLRQGKNTLSKVEKGQEAGIIISPLLDFTIGDMILCHS